MKEVETWHSFYGDFEFLAWLSRKKRLLGNCSFVFL